MGCKIAFWYESCTHAWVWDFVNKLCSYYGAEIVVVDAVGCLYQEDFAYPDLNSLLAAHKGHTKVFLAPDGETILDEFEHPAGDVLYLVGSAYTGFPAPVAELPGLTVRLRKPEVINAHQVLAIMFSERDLFLNGRRL